MDAFKKLLRPAEKDLKEGRAINVKDFFKEFKCGKKYNINFTKAIKDDFDEIWNYI